MEATHVRNLAKIILVNRMLNESIKTLMEKCPIVLENDTYLEGFFPGLMSGFCGYDNYTMNGEVFSYAEIEPLIIKGLKSTAEELGLSTDGIVPISDQLKKYTFNH